MVAPKKEKLNTKPAIIPDKAEDNEREVKCWDCGEWFKGKYALDSHKCVSEKQRKKEQEELSARKRRKVKIESFKKAINYDTVKNLSPEEFNGWILRSNNRKLTLYEYITKLPPGTLKSIKQELIELNRQETILRNREHVIELIKERNLDVVPQFIIDSAEIQKKLADLKKELSEKLAEREKIRPAGISS